MAVVKDQLGRSINIPDIGQVYRLDDPTKGLAVRSGNQLFTGSVQDIGNLLAQQRGLNISSGAQAQELGLKYLGEQGINYDTLQAISARDFADVPSFFERTGGFSRGQLNLENLNLLKGTPQTGEQITQSVSPDNPFGAVVTSNTQGQISASPSLTQSLLQGGLNPTQAATLQAFAQGSGGQPYPTQLLQDIGVVNKPSTPFIPGVQDIMSNPAAFGASTVPINASIPQTLDSSFLNQALGQPKTQNDILSQIYQQYQDFQQQYVDTLRQSQAEQAAQQQLDNLQQGALQGQVNIEGQRIPMPLIGGQLDELKKQIAFQQIPLEQKLKRLTTERQGKLDTLKAQLGFGENALDIALQLQKMSKPDVVSTQVNKDTGDVLVISQNADGSFSTTKAGNIGASKEKNYTNTGTYRDSNNNEVFWGLTPEGKVETKVLGKSGVGDDNKNTNIVPLLSGNINAAINGGATPDQAVAAAVQIASNQGIDVKREDYTKLLETAKGQKTVFDAQNGTLSGPQTKIPQPTQTQNQAQPADAFTSFFTRLFGR